MILIKKNVLKGRSIYKDGNSYIKIWNYIDKEWLEEHIALLDKFCPNLITDYGYTDNTMHIKMNKLHGKSGQDFAPTQKFIKKIHHACLDNLNLTYPYAHGDWVLSNMIIQNDKVCFIDWDNLKKVSYDVAIKKMNKDLSSAFVNDFERYLNDSKSI